MSKFIKTHVAANDMCIGCGGCAVVDNSVRGMALDARGQYVPVFAKDADINGDGPAALGASHDGDAICPFSDRAENEDTIAARLFGNAGLSFDKRLGFYDQVMAGYANEGDFRLQGSSGGLTNWLLKALLDTGEVDAVIGVGTQTRSDTSTHYGYQIIESAEQLHRLAKSKYYPVSFDDVIKQVRTSHKRYAFVGLPCFVKTVRNMCHQQPALAQRIPFAVAIVCGHLKSRAFSEAIGWELGTPPERLASVDFRVKVPGEPANRYAVSVEDSRGNTHQKQVFDLYTSDWGLGLFKYKACDFCDDIAGETADATLGDAWLPGPVKAWQGNNIVITRHPVIARLLADAQRDGRVVLAPLAADDFVASQAANYRHRHEGLAVRLQDAREQGHWVPQKRVAPSYAAMSRQRQEVIRLRSQLREKSHEAFLRAKQQGRFKVFTRAMSPLVLRYHWQAGSLIKYLVKRLLVQVRRVVKIRV